ncbi:unnamed protein product [Rotaria sp. Silwood2]|nr:unnamed protein product [Rotaria sp. Silwood2]CAF3197048.1 unnamed protein product [Rotaria sp. Silwood2]CAF4525636.1 unnamed protein product [Rotaria sp. Silwood2]CAF4582767.1 unnamed protein product [Rotaria sp. Silwood2]
MSTVDVDMTLYFHKKHTPPPSVLLLTVPNDKYRDYETSPSTEHRPSQPKKRQPPHMIGLHVSNLDIHDTSGSSFGWKRYSYRNNQSTLAPDIAYRNTYLEETKQDKININNENNHSCLLSSRNNKSSQSKFKDSSSYYSLESSSQQINSSRQYSTIYDCIRASIRDIERRRNLKQQNITSRVKRPQNDDSTLRRVLGEKKSPIRTSISRNSSTTTATTTTTTTTTTQTISSLFNNDLKSPQSFVNYINYSRALHSPTSNQSYQQHRFILSQN